MNRKTILLRAVGTIRFDAISFSALGISAGAAVLPGTASGQIFVASGNTIGEYTTSGATINASLIPGLSFPMAIAISGSDLFVARSGYEGNTTTIGEYTTSGATVNATLVPGSTFPSGMVGSGSDLFVLNQPPPAATAPPPRSPNTPHQERP